MKKRLVIGLSALALAGVGAAAAYVLYVRSQGGDVRGSSTIDFVTTETTPPPPPPPPPPKHHRRAQGVVWPQFGYDTARTHFAVGSSLRPPFRRLWIFHGRSLIEFPPAVAYGRLFVATSTGRLYAVSERTGRKIWVRTSGRCTAASPAVADELVVEVYLNRPPCSSMRTDIDGRVGAYDVRRGKVVWSRTIGPSETSPLVARGLVFVGDWRGDVYALALRTGRIRWRFHAGGKVKGGIALAGDRVFFGAYDGHVYALGAGSGKLLWEASSQPRLGAQGTFYSTPAAAYGRVYVGSTDGKVYSYGAASGELRFAISTGGYVYGSPAISHERVYIGSYSGRFYALDAATGDVKWSFAANGPISGSATVLDGIVYFSTLKERTYGLDAATGKLLWSFPDGKFSPVVADEKHVYLVGFGRVYGMVPR